MDRRTKILTAFFGILIGYALIDQVAYPQWIKPLLTIGDRVAERGKELEKLERGENEVERAKTEYLGYAERCGSWDVDEVETEARSQLIKLIGKHGIQGSSMSAGRSQPDNKTGISKVSLDFGGEATLAAAVALLKDLAELPFVGRVSNVKLSKIGGSRASRDSDRVNLNASFELMVPPQKWVGTIDKTKLKQPESYVRHENRNYAMIWERKPFSEFEPTRPLAITMKPKTLNPKVNSPAALQAVVSGGNGDYKYAWSPAEGLSDAAIPNPKVDTATPGTKVFTLTVTDARGQTASDNITVTVQEAAVVRKDPPKVVEPPPPPVKEIPQPWPDGRFMQVVSAWTMFDGGKRTDELLVYNNKSRSNDYYKAGDKFDGGELVFVHQRGAVGRRNDEYFLYPIGVTLDCAIAAADGVHHPDLLNASRRHQAEHPPKVEALEAAEGTAHVVPPPAAAVTPVEEPTVPTDMVGPPATLAGPAEAPLPNAGAGTIPDRAGAKGRKQRTGSMGSSRNSARKPAGTNPGGENAPLPPNEKKTKEQAPPTPE